MQNKANCNNRIQKTGDRSQKKKMQNKPNSVWMQIDISSLMTSN
jgi:hypothetical protein